MTPETKRRTGVKVKYTCSRVLFPACLLLMFCFCLPLSCEKMENPVPNWRVYLNLDLTFEDKELKAVPAYKAFTIKDANLAQGESAGFGGVLVVHNMFGEYKAFDLSCPYEARQDVLIKVDNEILYAVCPVCGTKYDVGTGYGAPIGMGRHYLRIYTVTQNGNKLLVTN
jgi:nitrite reductase/ring-hydroxylating ferredoxin subunit